MNPAPAPKIWTTQSILDWCRAYFQEKGLPAPRLDGELLLAHTLGCSRLDLYLKFDRPLSASELSGFKSLVLRRLHRVPVAYLTGEVGFWNQTLKVGPGCLIPRPDTETLVEATLVALQEIGSQGDDPGGSEITVAELGTGCGAIPLAVCSEVQGLTWIAVERSIAALAMARDNLALHHHLLAPRDNRVRLIQGEGMEPFSRDFRPSLVLSNPPYIPSAEIDSLEPEVSCQEPREALDGGADGLDVHRYLVDYAARNLPAGGQLLMEIGAEQEQSAVELIAAQSLLEGAAVRRDLAGRPRVVSARRRGTGV